MRSQDIPELVSPTGAVWIGDIKTLKTEGTFFGKDHIYWKMDWISGIDIDDEDDLKLALALKCLR